MGFSTTPLMLGAKKRPVVHQPRQESAPKEKRKPTPNKHTQFFSVRVYPTRAGVYDLRAPDGHRHKMRWSPNQRCWVDGKKLLRPEELRGWRWRGLTEEYVTAHNLKPPMTAPPNEAARYLAALAARFQLNKEVL